MKMDLMERARRYIAKMPPSIEKQNGSTAFLNVALALVRKFDLPCAGVGELLREWNTLYSKPQWDEAEILHKLKDAYAKGGLPRGHQGTRPRPSPTAPTPVEGAKETFGSSVDSSGTLMERARRSLKLALEQASGCPFSNEEVKARQRAAWPDFRPMILSEMEQLAALRKLSMGAVYQAHSLGVIRAAEVDGFPCYVLRGPAFAQARRMDGGRLIIQGKEAKAKTLPGSAGSFLGLHLLGDNCRPVLLVEGCIGLLEALEAIRLHGRDESPGGWSPMASVSASSRFDERLLNRLRGRRIRIVPDAGPAGVEFCAIATASLRSADCTVDAFRLPPGIGDLGPIVADPSRHTTILQQLFSL
jgi:hypothetical protein